MAGNKKKSIKEVLEGAKQTLLKPIHALKRIIKMIKFFVTPLGTIIGWILFALFAILLLAVVVQTVAKSFADLLGFNTNYVTYDEDKETILNFSKTQNIMDDIYASGYSSQLNPNDYINYKAFEYAVLMDAAEYIRINGQEEFDVTENQGIYKKERELLAKQIEEAEKLKASTNANSDREPAVKLFSTTSENDQSVVESNLCKIVEKGANSRNINVVNEATEDGIDADIETKGGNNRVMGPFLVYEFVYDGNKTDSGDSLDTNAASSSDEGTDNSETTTGTVDNSNVNTDGSSGDETTENEEYREFLDETNTAENLFTNNQLGGSIIPYIYVVREEIDFQYFFNSNNTVLEIPLLLNANVGTSVEKSKEVLRATKGASVKVWPDRNMDKDDGTYTWIPYYTDETNCTVYKIPLKTLIGRYMPRTELLYAWTMIKTNIDQGTSIAEEDETLKLGQEVVTKIKQIYNDACLTGETTKKETGTMKDLVSNEYETIQYEYDTSNKTSFVTFEKAGIETTRYGELKKGGASGEIEYIKDFVSAYSIAEEFTLYQTDIETGEDVEYVMNMSELDVAGIKYGKVLRATGNMEEGYTPPGTTKPTGSSYYYYGKEGLDEQIKSAIIDAACNKLGILRNEYTYADLKVEFSPIFTVAITTAYTNTMKIEHRRMPVLLVSSAITWAKEVKYTHSITQNLFEQTDHSYIVPNCVSSMGMQSFVADATCNYRGKAYEDVFKILQEKDVVSMLLSLETYAEEGNNDCYEYMRDLYKLVKATQNYSQTSGNELINPDTYTYVYLQDSILYYDDSQTQKIYWLELLGQRGAEDALTQTEVETMRTRDPVLKWQIVEYEKYDECDGKVYALNPFGSAYARAYVQLALDTGNYDQVAGKGKGQYGNGHSGIDLTGRSIIDSMLNKKSASEESPNLANQVYEYSLKQLTKVYGNEEKAKNYLDTQLEEQVSYMPVVAIAPGRVVSVGFTGRSGFYVAILHDNQSTVRTAYCHLKRWPNVNVGDHVGAGTVIGYEGNTGRSTGTHLHFQITMSNAEVSTSINSQDVISLDDEKMVEDLDNAVSLEDSNDNVSIVSGTVNPADYIYPTFTPFYYYEKAQEDNFDLGSDYMTLYRTVFLMSDDSTGDREKGGTSNGNSVPQKPLLSDYQNLVQDIGKREKSLSMSGDLGWAKTERNDLYLREEYFDITKAREAGLLNTDSDLLTVLYGYIPVKIGMPGALPALTRDELVYILQNWLSNRYKEDEFNWLMENVFTEETIDKIIETQNEYQVSAVFALAVGTLEQQLGVSYYRDSKKFLGKPGNYNIFSIKGDKNGGVNYIGALWNRYDSYGDAFAAFAQLIAGENYFEAGRFTIATIGPTYCPTGVPPGSHWSGQVTSIALQILQYYVGDNWSSNLTFSDNSEFVGIARDLIMLLAQAGYSYSTSVGIPQYDPFAHQVSGSKSIDCTAYVSGVIKAYGIVHNIPELINIQRFSSDSMCNFAKSIANGATDGAKKYFQVVWIRENQDMNHPDGSQPSVDELKNMMMPGDILIFYGGHRGNDFYYKGCCRGISGKGAHHAEIFEGNWSGSSCTIFSCGSAPTGAYSRGEPKLRYLGSAGKNGNTRGTLFAILRLTA